MGLPVATTSSTRPAALTRAIRSRIWRCVTFALSCEPSRETDRASSNPLLYMASRTIVANKRSIKEHIDLYSAGALSAEMEVPGREAHLRGNENRAIVINESARASSPLI